MGRDELSQQFKMLYAEWGRAAPERSIPWIERHLAEDFLSTAQPWPALCATKQEMLDAARAKRQVRVSWIDVKAQRHGSIVLTTQLAAFASGKRALYIGAWRQQGEFWQVFDNHLVGILQTPSVWPSNRNYAQSAIFGDSGD
jgi:hypothetical protein